MRIPRWLWRSLYTLLGLFFVLAALIGGLWWYFHPPFDGTPGIEYGRRHGEPLTFDIVHSKRPNGIGILLLVSGGWKSGPSGFRPWMVAPLTRRGYSVFAVSHLSQPRATVMEIVEDMHRAVRFIRSRANEYGIDPDRIGVTGGSAGGHLSLMLATRGGVGEYDPADATRVESSSIQAAAIFYPVTDLLNLGASTENAGDGGPPKSFVKAFGPRATNLVEWKEIGRDVSPVYHVTSNLPPVLIIHGGADTLTPLEQSQWFVERAQEQGREVELLVRPGKEHGWITMFWEIRLFADWFDRHLRAGG